MMTSRQTDEEATGSEKGSENVADYCANAKPPLLVLCRHCGEITPILC